MAIDEEQRMTRHIMMVMMEQLCSPEQAARVAYREGPGGYETRIERALKRAEVDWLKKRSQQ